jgi:AbrB family looped-hinge helix DNA binding protein
MSADMTDSNHAPRIGQRGQLTVPSSIRKQLGLQAGDRVNLICRGDELVVRPARKTLLDLRGSVPVKGPQDFQAIREEVLSEHVRQRIPPR